MLFLLRKIRRKLLNSNKVTTYLLYAVGEIILVMIGILLAVQIDDWNEHRKTEIKIESLLREVQDDLALDIVRANEVLDFFNVKDSLVNLALRSQLTIEDYKNPESRPLRTLTTSAMHVSIHDNGYKKLMEQSDNIQPKFQELVDLLNEMYGYQKYEIDMDDERINLLTDRNHDFYSDTKPWFYKLNDTELDDEAIDYYMNDPLYKNKLRSYRTYAIYSYALSVFQFTKNAQHAYRMIHEQLEDSSSLPDFIAQNQITPTSEDVARFSGTYEVVESSIDDTWIGRTFTFEYVDGRIKYSFGTGQSRTALYFRSQDQLYSGYGVKVSIDPSSTPTTTVLNFYGAVMDAKLVKIK